MVPVPSTAVDSNRPSDAEPLTGDDPTAPLAQWVAEGRVDDAARDRERRRWLDRQAEEDASLTGALLELAELGRPVLLHTLAGAALRGPIVTVGTDVVILRPETGGETYVPVAAVATVRAADCTIVRGDHPPSTEITLHDLLVELAADQPDVVIRIGAQELAGRLRSAGHDVIAIAVGTTGVDPHHAAVHANPAAIDHLIVWSS